MLRKIENHFDILHCKRVHFEIWNICKSSLTAHHLYFLSVVLPQRTLPCSNPHVCTLDMASSLSLALSRFYFQNGNFQGNNLCAIYFWKIQRLSVVFRYFKAQGPLVFQSIYSSRVSFDPRVSVKHIVQKGFFSSIIFLGPSKNIYIIFPRNLFS